MEKISRKAQGGKVGVLIGALLFVVIMVALAPTMFTGLNTTTGPAWVNTALPIVVGAGLIMMTYRLFR